MCNQTNRILILAVYLHAAQSSFMRPEHFLSQAILYLTHCAGYLSHEVNSYVPRYLLRKKSMHDGSPRAIHTSSVFVLAYYW